MRRAPAPTACGVSNGRQSAMSAPMPAANDFRRWAEVGVGHLPVRVPGPEFVRRPSPAVLRRHLVHGTTRAGVLGRARCVPTP